LPVFAANGNRRLEVTLKGKRLFITGASRGIGLAIACQAARDGAFVAIAAKSDQPHPKLSGTIHTAAEAVKAAGGTALPIVCDVRDEQQVNDAVERTVQAFGGIDICINNASAIDLSGSEALSLKKYDLMHQINARGTFLTSRACVPHLRKSSNPHVLNISPPPVLRPEWFAEYPAYALSKFGMTFLALAMAEEFRDDGIAFNTLWPQTMIATAAVTNLPGVDGALTRSRRPEVMAEAAYLILNRPARECTGQHFIDEAVLIAAGETDMRRFRSVPGDDSELMVDLFIDASTRLPHVTY
jgi:citronellol/citronellal dehydrogenase